jgi:phage gpG-like protein
VSVNAALEPIVPAGLIDLLDGYERRLTTLAIPFAAVYRDFRQLEARRFDAEGPGWTPLAPSTVANRARAGVGPSPILEVTKRLRASLTETGANDAVLRDEGDSLFMGSKVPYAHWHQTGGSTAGRPPARPEVVITEADSVRWALIVARYLTGTGPVTGGVATALPGIGAGPSGL